MSEAVKLIPIKPDLELAQEIANELREAYKPVCAILTKAASLGFNVNVITGRTSQLSHEVVVADIQISKSFPLHLR